MGGTVAVDALRDEYVVTYATGRVCCMSRTTDDGVYLDALIHPPKIVSDQDWMAWHRKLGHMGRGRLIAALKHARIYMPDPCPQKLPFCEGCADAHDATDNLVNLRERPDDELQYYSDENSNSSRLAVCKLDVVVADIAGPYNFKAIGGSRFLLLIVHVRTRYLWVYPMVSTKHGMTHFRQWHEEVQDSCIWKLNTLRTEDRSEFLSRRFQDFIDEVGATHETSPPGYMMKEGMGIVKRAIRTIEDMVRPMMQTSRLRHSLWTQAALYAAWINNRVPTSALNGASPYKNWHNTLPSLQHAKTFGSVVWWDTSKASNGTEFTRRFFLRPDEEDENALVVKGFKSNKINTYGGWMQVDEPR